MLLLLRKQEPAAALARRYGVFYDATPYRWGDEFLEGGKAALAHGKGNDSVPTRRVRELGREVAERDRVIGELTIANRVLEKVSGGLN